MRPGKITLSVPKSPTVPSYQVPSTCLPCRFYRVFRGHWLNQYQSFPWEENFLVKIENKHPELRAMKLVVRVIISLVTQFFKQQEMEDCLYISN